MNFKSVSLKKHLIEGSLIVFSVLFALIINQSFENYKTQQKKIVARESILKELQENQLVLKKWKEKHIKVRNTIMSLVTGKNDSLMTVLSNYSYLNFGLLTDNQSLIDELLTHTAWETAKTTGIISEFDFETTQMLTRVYDLQTQISEKSLMNIREYYYESEAHDMKQINRILVQFSLRFWELTGQEEALDKLYEKAINDLPD